MGQDIETTGKQEPDVVEVDENAVVEQAHRLEEAKVEIMEIVDFLKKPDKYKSIGLNAKLFNETIALKNEIDKLKAAVNQ